MPPNNAGADLSPRSANSSTPALLALAAIAPIVFLAATRGLWAPDEPRYAEVAREAFEGDLVVMHLNGELYAAKPPLVYWMAGLMGSLSGWSELALRVPSILATLLSALLARRLARGFFGEPAATWAAACFLVSPMVVEIGGRLQLDPTLTCACLASVVFAHEARTGARSRTSGLLLAGICAGLAALTKGPPAWLHVGSGILALRWLGPPVANTRRAPVARPWLAWIGFVLLAVLPVAAWATSAALLQHARTGDWTYFRALFFGEHVGRVLDGTQHAGPPWQHLARFPWLFLPWTPLLAIALARVWNDVRAWRSRARTLEPWERARLALAAWFVFEFVVFSAMPPKRDLYLLPIYPVAAILCARELVAAGPRVRWLLASAALFLLVGVVLAGAGLWLALSPDPLATLARFDARAQPGSELADALELAAPIAIWLAAIGFAFVAGAALGARAIRRGDMQRGAAFVAGGLCAAAIVGALTFAPTIDARKSARELGEWLAARPEKPTAIACAGVQPEGYRFYGRVPTVKEEIGAALEREGAQFLALLTEREYAKLPEDVRARTRVLRSAAVGSRDVVVLGAAAR